MLIRRFLTLTVLIHFLLAGGKKEEQNQDGEDLSFGLGLNTLDIGKELPESQEEQMMDKPPEKESVAVLYRRILTNFYKFKFEDYQEEGETDLLLSKANGLRVTYEASSKKFFFGTHKKDEKISQEVNESFINKSTLALDTINKSILPSEKREDSDLNDLGELLFAPMIIKGVETVGVPLSKIRNLLSDEFKYILLKKNLKYIVYSLFKKLETLHAKQFRVCYWDPKTILIDESGLHIHFVDLPRIYMNRDIVNSCEGRTNPDFPVAGTDEKIDSKLYDVKAASQMILLVIFRHLRLNPDLLATIQMSQPNNNSVDTTLVKLLEGFANKDITNTLLQVTKGSQEIKTAEKVITGFNFYAIELSRETEFFFNGKSFLEFSNKKF